MSKLAKAWTGLRPYIVRHLRGRYKHPAYKPFTDRDNINYHEQLKAWEELAPHTPIDLEDHKALAEVRLFDNESKLALRALHSRSTCEELARIPQGPTATDEAISHLELLSEIVAFDITDLIQKLKERK